MEEKNEFEEQFHTESEENKKQSSWFRIFAIILVVGYVLYVGGSFWVDKYKTYKNEKAIESKSAEEGYIFVDGKLYEMPFSYEKLSKDYRLEEDNTIGKSLEPNKNAKAKLAFKDKKKLTGLQIYLYNPYEENRKLEQCQVTSLAAEPGLLGENVDVRLAGGITYGCSMTDVIDVFGKPQGGYIPVGEYTLFNYDYDYKEQTLHYIFLFKEHELVQMTIQLIK